MPVTRHNPHTRSATSRRSTRAARNSEGYAEMAITRHVDLLPIPELGAKYRYVKGKLQLVREKMPCDLIGVIKRSRGVMFAADVKRCEQKGGFPIYNETHIADHQKDALEAVGRNGGIAGLFIESAHTGRTYWLSWRHLRETKQIKWEDERMLLIGEPGVMADLAPVVAHVQEL